MIVVDFYFTGMRKTVLIFRDALGLYWQDRYKPIFEAIINLVVSIVLVKKFGIVGVLLGTFVSTLTTCMWVEPYILFKYGIKQNVFEYYKKIIVYTIIAFIISVTTYCICNVLITSVSVPAFILKIMICFLIPNISYYVLFHSTDEFKYFIDLLKKMAKKFLNNRKKDKVLGE